MYVLRGHALGRGESQPQDLVVLLVRGCQCPSQLLRYCHEGAVTYLALVAAGPPSLQQLKAETVQYSATRSKQLEG